MTFISSSLSHPFILIRLTWPNNLCSVTFKPCLSFQISYIRFLYSFYFIRFLFSFLTKWSIQKITFHDSYIYLLRSPNFRSLFLTTGPALLIHKTPAERGNFTGSSSPIHVVIIIIIIIIIITIIILIIITIIIITINIYIYIYIYL